MRVAIFFKLRSSVLFRLYFSVLFSSAESSQFTELLAMVLFSHVLYWYFQVVFIVCYFISGSVLMLFPASFVLPAIGY